MDKCATFNSCLTHDEERRPFNQGDGMSPTKERVAAAYIRLKAGLDAAAKQKDPRVLVFTEDLRVFIASAEDLSLQIVKAVKELG